ncbi:BLUF domain-containing protein [Spirosoma arcticum]
MEHCIVYFSSWTEPFREEDLSSVVEQSRQNNDKTGITGVMLYVRGNVIQVLEGEKEAIDTLYQRIERDQRHTKIIPVLNRPIAQRLFAAWSMGYETITTRQLEEIKMIVNLDNDRTSSAPSGDHIILKTIKVFYESNRYN